LGGAETTLRLAAGTPDAWAQLVLAHSNGARIVAIEPEYRYLGRKLDGFRAEMEERECRPASGVRWVREYLDGVRTLYVFQMLSYASEDQAGWNASDGLLELLRTTAGGIVYAEYEGWYVGTGDLIVWDFSDHVRDGRQRAAVLRDGRWVRFVMDRGNAARRAAFWRGEVPAGCE